MKLIGIILACLLLIPNLALGVDATIKTMDVENLGLGSDWTVMVYMCGDNDLEVNIDDSINWLEWTGSDDSITIVAQADYKDPAKKVRRYVIDYEKEHTSEIISSYNTLSEQNTGESQPLVNFVKWAYNNYPADRYCLVLWGHGSGWQGFLYDESQTDDMKMDEFKDAMSSIKSYIGKKIDIISFDTCLLSMIEVYYQIRDKVEICVGSEDFVYGSGFPYHMIFPDLKEDPNMATEDLAIEIIDAYESYHGSSSMALGAFYASKIKNLVEDEFADFAEKLSDYYSTFKSQINTAIKNTESFDIESYVITYFKDLYDFADELKKEMNLVTGTNKAKADELKDLAEDLIISLEDATIYFVRNEDKKPDAHGLSIYIPTSRKDYDTDYKDIDLCKNTEWEGFFNQCLSRTRNINPRNIILLKFKNLFSFLKLLIL